MDPSYIYIYIGANFDIGETLLPVLIQCTTENFSKDLNTVVLTSVQYYTALYIVDFVQTIWFICQLKEFGLELWNSYANCISWLRLYHSTVWIIDLNWTCCTRTFTSLKKLSSQVSASSHQIKNCYPFPNIYTTHYTRSEGRFGVNCK